MRWRTVLVVTLCMTLLAATVARAGEWVDDRYVASQQDYSAGRGKTLLLSTLLGMGTGFVLSGLVLIFYKNPDADRNFPVVMFVTVPLCTLGGLALGLTLPPNAADESSAASLRWDDGVDVSWRVPAITAAVDRWFTGVTEHLWHTNLMQVTF